MDIERMTTRQLKRRIRQSIKEYFKNTGSYRLVVISDRIQYHALARLGREWGRKFERVQAHNRKHNKKRGIKVRMDETVYR